MAKLNYKESIIGLDVGRSGVKIAFYFGGELKTHFIPSAIIPARPLTFDSNPKKTEENTVEVNGVKYFVGETAILQGATQTVGLSSNWLEGVEHQALLLRSKSLLMSYGICPKLIVAGLPVNTFQSHADVLVDQVASVFECNIIPVPQPYGVYQDALLNDDGRFHGNNVNVISKKFAVIDIGHFTTDILLMDNFNWIQESSGSTVGMSKAVTSLQEFLNAESIPVSIIECQEAMIIRKIKEYGELRDISNLVDKAIPTTIDSVIQEVKNKLGNQARTIDKILIAGGGAQYVYDRLAKDWKQTALVNNPRFSVAIGMRKHGLYEYHLDPSCIDA